jgi:phosphocarrier protein
MVSTQITIINKLGLHARASAKFATIASNFSSTIKLKNRSEQVDGKSIMNIMMLAASQGTTLELLINGKDQEEATKALTQLVNNRFEEEE